MTLTELRDRAYNNSVAHGFENNNFVERLCLIHSEVSEALECYREGALPHAEDYLIDKQGEQKPLGIPSELADIIIRVLDTCGAYHIDIEKAVLAKMAYNETRPFMHGKKL